jgi:hypothetical protein
MNYATAAALFVTMPEDAQKRVGVVFEDIYRSFPNVRDAFAEAVADEDNASKIRKLLEQKAEGKA